MTHAKIRPCSSVISSLTQSIATKKIVQNHMLVFNGLEFWPFTHSSLFRNIELKDGACTFMVSQAPNLWFKLAQFCTWAIRKKCKTWNLATFILHNIVCLAFAPLWHVYIWFENGRHKMYIKANKKLESSMNQNCFQSSCIYVDSVPQEIRLGNANRLKTKWI